MLYNNYVEHIAYTLENFRERSAPDCFTIKFIGGHIDGKKVL